MLSRWAARAVVPVLALGQLLVLAAPAHAAATPWRFVSRVTGRRYIPAQTIASINVGCPSGYVALGGGVSALSTPSQFEVVAQYPLNSSSWVVIGHNYDTATMTVDLATTCAYGGSVGSLDLVSADFTRAGNGMAGGTVACPTGKVAITGGADWNSFATNTRRIDTFSPAANGRGWYASGYSPEAVTLHVEAYCVPSADIPVTPLVQYVDYAVAYDRAGLHQCPPGTRVASAGAFTSAYGSSAPDPNNWRGNWLSSAPAASPTAWSSLWTLPVNTRLTSVTWCLPASQPVATITQTPPSRTNSTTGTFAYSAYDPAGETLAERYCVVDESVISSCPMNTPVSFPGLAEGTHLFRVTVVNDSAQRGDATYSWTVDLTAPTATGPANGAPITGPLGVTFSEPVTGVSASTLQVRVAGQSATVPGTVATNGTGATWTPAAPLVPGESYTVSLASGIADVAGNALAPVDLTVRTALLVENTSPAVREYWDRDTSTSAAGGGYVASNNAGSSATWSVTAAAGQTASLYGLRAPDGGYAEVWLDGARKATVSSYAAAPAWRSRLWTSAALTAGPHTVQLRVLGTRPSASSGTWVSPDWLQVGSTVLQETAARQAFRRVVASPASGGSYDLALHRTYGDTGTAPSYAMTFKGTGVRLYVTRWPGAGSARVYVDGAPKATVSLTSSSTLYRQAAYTVTGLPSARHTVQVVAVGTSSGAASAVALDSFQVF